MQLKADVTGKEVDAGEMYNAYLNSYIELITKPTGLVTENTQAAKNRLATLQEWAKKAADAATEEERLAAAQKVAPGNPRGHFQFFILQTLVACCQCINVDSDGDGCTGTDNAGVLVALQDTEAACKETRKYLLSLSWN